MPHGCSLAVSWRAQVRRARRLAAEALFGQTIGDGVGRLHLLVGAAEDLRIEVQIPKGDMSGLLKKMEQ